MYWLFYEKHISQYCPLLQNVREAILRHCVELGENLEKPNEIALVIDGKTLKYALTCELRTEFLRLCISCKVAQCFPSVFCPK